MTRTPGFPRAAACLRERASEILDAWERQVRDLRGCDPGEPPSPVLRDDIPEMISALAGALSPPAVEPRSDRSPYDHALQRYAEDVPLERLVSEYGVLRAELFRTLAQVAPDELAGAWPLVMAHVDRAIEEAVARYSEQRARWLREREEELEALLEDLPVGVAVADAASGELVRTNRELARIQAGIAEARTAADIAALGVERPDGAPLEPSELPISRALRGDEVGSEELRVSAPSGRALAVDVRARPLRDPSGAVRGAVVIAADIDERVRTRVERQLFASTLGHDVRSPISTIRLAAQRLEQLDGSEQARKLSGGIVRSAQRLTDLVGELLELVRTLEGPLDLAREPVDLAELSRALVADKRAAWEDVRLRVDAPEPVVGDWDRTRLLRILENLLENARKHGETDEIDLAVAREGEVAVLSISNRGGPIWDEPSERLFEPRTRAGRGAGSGLGLFIVKQLAEAHGGRVTMATGAGTTTFRVFLPVGGAEPLFDSLPGAS